MKVYYQCETCGKKYFAEDEAKKCEKKHEVERIEKEHLTAEKETRSKRIEKDIQSYIDDYNEFPKLKLNGKIKMNHRDWLLDYLL